MGGFEAIFSRWPSQSMPVRKTENAWFRRRRNPDNRRYLRRGPRTGRTCSTASRGNGSPAAHSNGNAKKRRRSNFCDRFRFLFMTKAAYQKGGK